jgi:hypothetical protein
MKSMRISVLLAVPLLSLAACGGPSEEEGIASAGGSGSSAPKASASQSVAPDTARLRWARCLREQGVNMPDDPKDMPKGGLAIPDKAAQACERHQAPGKTIDMNDPEVRDRFARFAKCMREHGYDMPDNAPPDVHLKDPRKWETASKSCNHLLREQNQ